MPKFMSYCYTLHTRIAKKKLYRENLKYEEASSHVGTNYLVSISKYSQRGSSNTCGVSLFKIPSWMSDI